MTHKDIVELVKNNELAVKLMKTVTLKEHLARFFVVPDEVDSKHVRLYCYYHDVSSESLASIAESVMPGYSTCTNVSEKYAVSIYPDTASCDKTLVDITELAKRSREEVIELLRNDDIVVQYMKLLRKDYPETQFYVFKEDCPTSHGCIHLLCNSNCDSDTLDNYASKVMPGYDSREVDDGKFHLIPDVANSFRPSMCYDVTEVCYE